MAKPLFAKVVLPARSLMEQREFYACRLNLPLIAESPKGFSVQAGATELAFEKSGREDLPACHIAFNIPENQIAEALAWTLPRAFVVAPASGDPIYDFATWNAHAFYFLDADGNLLEFIARHSMSSRTDGMFNAGAIQCVSEVGLATSDVVGTCQELIGRLGIACYPDPASEPNSDFQALGDERGLFVVARTGRLWLGSDKRAELLPLRIGTSKGIELKLTDTLAEIC